MREDPKPGTLRFRPPFILLSSPLKALLSFATSPCRKEQTGIPASRVSFPSATILTHVPSCHHDPCATSQLVPWYPVGNWGFPEASLETLSQSSTGYPFLLSKALSSPSDSLSITVNSKPGLQPHGPAMMNGVLLLFAAPAPEA